MELIADILLVAGALGAGLYCYVLSRRLKRFTDLEKGVGGAVAVLSTQADELKKSLDSARDTSDQSGAVLKELTQRAETVAQRLELMMASMHDLDAQNASAEPQTDEVSPDIAEEPEEDTPEPDVPEEDLLEEDGGSEKLEPVEAVEKPSEPEQVPSSEKPAQKPGGVMFFRHNRTQTEAAT